VQTFRRAISLAITAFTGKWNSGYYGLPRGVQ
jgi:hypothetical protein